MELHIAAESKPPLSATVQLTPWVALLTARARISSSSSTYSLTGRSSESVSGGCQNGWTLCPKGLATDTAPEATRWIPSYTDSRSL